MYPVSLDEVDRLARNRGFSVEKVHQAADQQGRAEVSWTCVALRLPDDGTGALPLLRHVILNDQHRQRCTAVLHSLYGRFRGSMLFGHAMLGFIAENMPDLAR